MTTQPSTSLRVRFAKAQGVEDLDKVQPPSFWQRLPDPTDANTVRKVLMGMTEEEWENFCVLLYEKLEHTLCHNYRMIYHTLKQEPTTLAELICEVRNV